MVAETHLPKALAFVPYFVANAVLSAFSEALQAFAAVMVACVWAFVVAFAVVETHFPYAFASAFLPLPFAP